MSVSSMLKMVFNHLKKSYLIFCSSCIALGLLMLIPAIKNINIDYVSLLTLSINLIIISCLIVSSVLGKIIYYDYGKSLSLVQNNKKIILITGPIICVINAFVFTIISNILLIPNGGFNFKATTIFFLSYIVMYYFGALFSIFIIKKTKIVLTIFSIIVTISLTFTAKLNDLINIIKITIFDKNINGTAFIIFLLILGLSFTGLISFIYYKFDTKKVYCK